MLSKQIDLWDFVPYINQLVAAINLEKEKAAEDNQDMLAEIAANFADSF